MKWIDTNQESLAKLELSHSSSLVFPPARNGRFGNRATKITSVPYKAKFYDGKTCLLVSKSAYDPLTDAGVVGVCPGC